MVFPLSNSMRSNEGIVEGGAEKRRSNRPETGGIPLPAQPQTNEQISIQIPTTALISPLSQQNFNPFGYSVPGDPLVLPLQGSSPQPPSHGTTFPTIGQQGGFLNFSGGPFPALAEPYPPITFTYQQQPYSIPPNGYGPNDVGLNQSHGVSSPGQVDRTLYLTCL